MYLRNPSYGYGYLIEPMMKSGGYATVSERMGINLNARTLKDRDYYERINPPVALRKAETDGFLTLGRWVQRLHPLYRKNIFL